MKKLVAGLLALSIVFGTAGTFIPSQQPLFAVDAAAEETQELPMSGKCGENLTWKIDKNGTLTISGTGAMYDYLPETEDFQMDRPTPPWYLRTDIKKVVIEDGVTYIGDYSFYVCPELTSVSIPDSVTAMGAGVFMCDLNLEDIDIPSSVTKIGSAPFTGTGWVTEQEKTDPLVIVNDNVVEARNCEGDVVIPDGVKCITGSSFFSNVKATSITVPDSVTEIGSCAFWGCSELEKVTLSKNLKKIDISAFADCKKLKEVSIPDTVTEIGESAFRQCDSLTEVTVPKSVTTIGRHALGYVFDKDASKTVKMQDFTVKGYKDTAAEKYAKDNGFEFVALEDDDTPTSGKCGENVTWKFDKETGTLTISGTGEMKNPFYYTKDGTDYPYSDLQNSTGKVIIEDGITGLTSFNSWSKLEEIVIPKNCTEFSEGFAIGTPWLEKMREKDPLVIVNGVLIDARTVKDKKLVLTDDVKELGQGPIFGGNKNITKLVLPGTITEIPSYAFQGMESLEEISIPDSVTSVGIGIFCNCNKLKKVEFPDNIKSLCAVFDGCNELEEVVLPKNLEKIESFGFDALTYGLFGNCPKLKKVTIPKSVTEIGEGTLGFDYSYKDGMIGDVEVKKNDLTICGYKGTAAEKYAKDNGFEFVALDKDDSSSKKDDSSSKPDSSSKKNDSSSSKPDSKPDDSSKPDDYKFAKGDANGDGDINVTDIAVTAAHIKGIKALTGEQQKTADVDNSGELTVTDIAMIAAHIKGIKALS